MTSAAIAKKPAIVITQRGGQLGKRLNKAVFHNYEDAVQEILSSGDILTELSPWDATNALCGARFWHRTGIANQMLADRDFMILISRGATKRIIHELARHGLIEAIEQIIANPEFKTMALPGMAEEMIYQLARHGRIETIEQIMLNPKFEAVTSRKGVGRAMGKVLCKTITDGTTFAARKMLASEAFMNRVSLMHLKKAAAAARRRLPKGMPVPLFHPFTGSEYDEYERDKRVIFRQTAKHLYDRRKAQGGMIARLCNFWNGDPRQIS